MNAATVAGPAIQLLTDRWSIVHAAGEARGLGSPACHDRTPFVSIVCVCGYPIHLHEPELDSTAAGDDLAVRCPRCRKWLGVPVDLIRRALTEAWTAPA